MANLDDVWGSSHGIHTSTHNYGDHAAAFSGAGLNLGFSTRIRAQDISGVLAYISQPYPQKSEDAIEQKLDESDTFLEQLRSRFETLNKQKDLLDARIAQLEDAAKAIDKTRADLSFSRNGYYNLILQTPIHSPEQVNNLMEKKAELYKLEKESEERASEAMRIELQQYAKDLETVNDSLSRVRGFLKKSVEALAPKGNQSQHVCPVCLEKEVGKVCIPCGHTFCGDCSTKQKDKCSVCRVKIDKAISLYFS